MKPLLPSNVGGSPAAEPPVSQPTAKPFDELKLSSAQIEHKVARLKAKGYFKIPMSRVTRDFLEAQPVKGAFIHKDDAVSFVQTEFEKATTATAEEIVGSLTGNKMTLKPNEFEVRWPAPGLPDQWHQDVEPKVLTCITTLAGPPTQFVSPKTFRDQFTQRLDARGRSELISATQGEFFVADAIRKTKNDQFYFFAARGIEEASVPKLVHRAPKQEHGPGKPKRAIFLARSRRQGRWCDGARCGVERSRGTVTRHALESFARTRRPSASGRDAAALSDHQSRLAGRAERRTGATAFAG